MPRYHDLIESFAQTRVGGWMFVNVFNRVDRVLMRVSKGRLNTGLGTGFHTNAVLLICKGAKSGIERQVPLLSTPVGDDFLLVASKVGDPKNPAWYFNLKAHPECTILRNGETVPCVAREATGAERERLWKRAVDNYSGYATYQTRTDRIIPVMVLSRRA